MPVGVFEDTAGTRGDRGRLLGAAGDGGLFLGFGVLMRKEEMKVEVEYESVGGTGDEVSQQSRKKVTRFPVQHMKLITRSCGRYKRLDLKRHDALAAGGG